MKKVALEIELFTSTRTRQTVEQIADLELQLSQVNKELREARKTGADDAYKQLRVQSQSLKGSISDLNKDLRQQKKEFEAVKFAPGSYRALSAELSKTKREFQELSEEARNGIGGRDLLRRIQRLDTELKQIDRNVGVFSRNVGNYASAFRGAAGLLAGLGIGIGIQEVVQQATQAISTFKDFQQEIATLGAISGASGQELQALEDNARSLGETTQFTALQVAQLQTNFARIGFTSQQILAATEATVNLAIATTESVEKTSEVVGAAINGFSLSADEAERVTDVLAAAFNSTALNLEKYAEAQKFAAATAAAANIDIEATTAALGALANAGLEGSQQGTVLRRIISDLSNENSKLAKFVGFNVKNSEDFTRALKVLSNAQLDNAKAYDLVGRIAQSGLLILANNADKVEELTVAYRNAQGEAARTARVVGDTLAQDLLKAQSAIEGLRINFVDLANNALRASVQGFTNLVATIGEFIKQPVSERLEEERQGLNNLVVALTSTNASEEQRGALIDEIKLKYPEFLDFVDVETASNEELQVALERVNEEYKARILLQKLNEAVQQQQLAVQRAQNVQETRRVQLAAALVAAREALGDSTVNLSNAEQRLAAEARSIYDQELRRNIALNDQARVLSQLRQAVSAFSVAELQQLEATNALNDAEGERAKNLDVIKEQFPELVQAIEEIERVTSPAEDAIGAFEARLQGLSNELDRAPAGGQRFRNLVTQFEQAKQDLDNTLQDEGFLGLDAVENEFPVLAGLLEEIEAKIGSAADGVGKSTEKLVKGSLAFLQRELQNLQKTLDNTPADGEKYIAVLKRIEDAQAAVNEEIQKRNLLSLDLTDFLGTDADVDANIKALQDALQFQKQAQELANTTPDVDVQANIEAIKKVRNARLDSIREQFRAGVLSEEQFNQERELIASETELELIRIRLSQQEVGSEAYLDLKQQEADKVLEIERNTNAALLEDQRRTREQIRDLVISSANSIAGSLIGIEEAKLDKETRERNAALEAEYEARIENAQGNTALQEQLQAELDAKQAELEKEAAKRRKAIAIKEAIVQASLAAIKTIAELGFANPFIGPALAGLAATTAAQIALIEAQEFARGGKIKGKSHSEGGEQFTVRSTGQRVELEGGEGVVNKRSMASREVLTVTGTPAQIASEINALHGYGVRFDRPAFLKKMFQTGGEIAPPVQLVNPNASGSVAIKAEVLLPDEQIDRFADTVAAKVAAETREAVQDGIAAGDRINERKAFVKTKTGI